METPFGQQALVTSSESEPDSAEAGGLRNLDPESSCEYMASLVVLYCSCPLEAAITRTGCTAYARLPAFGAHYGTSLADGKAHLASEAWLMRCWAHHGLVKSHGEVRES